MSHFLNTERIRDEIYFVWSIQALFLARLYCVGVTYSVTFGVTLFCFCNNNITPPLLHLHASTVCAVFLLYNLTVYSIVFLYVVYACISDSSTFSSLSSQGRRIGMHVTLQIFFFLERISVQEDLKFNLLQ